MPDKVRHIVKGNDHLPFLASVAGYRDWHSLWEQNKGRLGQRKNPLILFHGDKNIGGDILFIETPDEKEVSGSTDQHHPFSTKSDKIYLKLRVMDEQLQPLPTTTTYELYVDGRKYEGNIGAGGMIETEVSRGAQIGKLVVHYEAKNVAQEEPPWPAVVKGVPGLDGAMAGTQAAKTGATPVEQGKKPTAPPKDPDASPSGTSGDQTKKPDDSALTSKISVEFPLEIGRIDPIQEPAPNNRCIAGVQQRLNNLGYDAGPVDGLDGPMTKAGVKRFQRRFKLDVDGIAGPITQGALHDFHDQPGQAPEEEQPKGGSVVSATGSTTSGDSTQSQESGDGGQTTTDNIAVTGGEKTSTRAVDVLKAILKEAGLTSATISSGSRTAADQARVMYENIVAHGVESQKDLYGSNGDKVIDVYVANKTKPKDDVISLMKAKIEELGPANVSKHCSNNYDVIDVAPSSISDKDAFVKAVKANKDVSKYILPPDDPAYHLEIPKA